jgi:undecaprenyl-diphosphatase
MDYLQTVILGVVQGITEFLPISSDGHLLVIGELLNRMFGRVAGTGDENLLLTVALHIGTLAAILIVYWADLWKLLRNFKLCLLIVLATIPAAVVGLALKNRIEETFESPTMAALGWLATAVFLWIGQRYERAGRTFEQVSWSDALLVGCFQATALLPGVSRSGTTIASGMLGGLKRDAATSFSFLIAIPAIAGAIVVKLGPPLIRLLKSTPEAPKTFAGEFGGYAVGPAAGDRPPRTQSVCHLLRRRRNADVDLAGCRSAAGRGCVVMLGDKRRVRLGRTRT